MHNIFDFVERDKKTYLPKQASTEIGKLERTLKIGRYRIPLERPAAAAAAQVEAVLDHPRRERHLEHGAARADHVPARQVLRRAALGDDGARPPGHARHVPALHDAAGRAARSKVGCASRSSARGAGDGATWRGVLQGPENSFRRGQPAARAADPNRGRSRARARRASPSARTRSSSRRASSATG